jgi:DNA end-binding protein Ku
MDVARSIWKGSIAFGLVNIPVELYGAVRDHRPRFRLLHAKDETPVRYERVCQREGKPVAWEDLVKGYEYEKGQFVVLTKDDFKTAALQKTKTVDILDFVKADEIDERYFETPYYLQPAKGAERSYALLREAIRESGRIGIGKIILREAQHLAAIEVIGDALVLTMMRFADELADLEDFKFPSADGIRKPELAMARQLVESLSAEWDPAKYTDEYRDNLMRVIKGKIQGRAPRLKAREEARGADVIDLMSRLKASLEQREGRETSGGRRASKQEGRGRGARKRSAATGRKKPHRTRRAA